MHFIRSFFSVLAKPSRFEKDWYGYLTNQMSHIALGIISTWISCVVVFSIIGDMPYRIKVFFGMAIIYGAKEIVFDKWHGFDTIEDCVFVVIYGCAGTLISFKAVKENSADVIFNTHAALPILVVCSAHLFLGCLYRWLGAKNDTPI